MSVRITHLLEREKDDQRGGEQEQCVDDARQGKWVVHEPLARERRTFSKDAGEASPGIGEKSAHG